MMLRIDRATEVREMMAKISTSSRPFETIDADALKDELEPKRLDVSALPTPARTGPSPRRPSAPLSARGPSPKRAAPSPRSLASARGVKADAILSEWGVPGNRIYQEAAAEAR